jgi:hypothetical protein
MFLRVSGAPLNDAIYSVSEEPALECPAITDIRFNALEKWNLWNFLRPCVRPFLGTTASPGDSKVWYNVVEYKTQKYIKLLSGLIQQATS